MRNSSNYQDLLKTLAVISMLIDHIGLYFFPELDLMRMIGRTSMPIFCFFAGYNFHGKPNLLILFLGVLLYMAHTIIFWQFLTTNILIPIFLGQVYIYYFKNKLSNFYSSLPHVIITASLWTITWFIVDYGSLVITIMILGYIAKHDRPNLKLAALISTILSVLHTFEVFDSARHYIITVLLVSIFQYFLIIAKELEYPITFNVNFISRNALLIYFTHLIIIELAWLYHLMGWW